MKTSKSVNESNDFSTIIKSVQNKSQENSLHQLFYPIQPEIDMQNMPSLRSLNLQSDRQIEIDKSYQNKNYDALYSSRINQEQQKQQELRDYSFCDCDMIETKYDLLKIEQKFNLLEEIQNNSKIDFIALLQLIFLSFMLILIPLQYSNLLFYESVFFLIIGQIVNILINIKLMKKSLSIQFRYLSITTLMTIFMALFFDSIYILIVNMIQVWILQHILWHQFQQFIQQLNISQYKMKENIEKSIKLIFQTIILVNQLICYHYKISMNQEEDTTFEQYQRSFEFAIRSLTFNSNENLDKFNTEQIVILSVIRVFIILYIFFSILQNYLYSDQLYNFFNKNKVSLQTRIQILQYQSNNNISRNELILSEELIKLIKIDTLYPVLKLIFGKYSQITLMKCISICEIIQCQQNEFIVQESIEDDNSLYYFIEGEGCIQSKVGNVCHRFKAPYEVGELSFYTKNQRTASVLCESYCQVLKIKRQEFINILSYYDKQQFHQTRDLIIFSKLLPIKCFFCLKNTHVFNQCSELKYNQIVEESSKEQNRMYKSRRKRSCNARQIRKYNCEPFKEKKEDSLSYMPAQMISLSMDSQDSESNFSPTANFIFLNNQNQKDILMQELYSLSFDIDQEQSFTKYFPQSNLDVVINNYNMFL